MNRSLRSSKSSDRPVNPKRSGNKRFHVLGMDATMYRLILIVLALHASTAIGNDYILRVDEIERAVDPGSKSAPHEITTCSLEVAARPHLPFHGHFKFGEETVSLSGELRPADDGDFTADFHFVRSVDTGLTVLNDDGTHKPVVEKSRVRTIVTIAVGSSVDIAGLFVKDVKTRQICYVVSLSRYEPSED